MVFGITSCGEREQSNSAMNEVSKVSIITENSSSLDLDEDDKLQSLLEIPMNNLTESSNEDDLYNKYWTKDGTKTLLDYCINNELWYHGEYSILYEMIGKEYTVLSIQVLQQGCDDWENISFLFSDKVNYPADVIVIRQQGPRGYSEPFISEDIESLHLESETDLVTYLNSARAHYLTAYYEVYKTPEYALKITEPTCPKYAESKAKDKETDKLKIKMAEYLKEEGYSGKFKAYVKDFVSDEASIDEDDTLIAYLVQTDVFVTDEDDNVYLIEYFSEYLMNLNEYENIGDLFGISKISDAENQYYFNQVKKTTDIVFSLEV